MRRRLPPHLVYPAQDPRARAHFITVRGFRTRIVEAGPSDGPPVVCIAGWASSAYEYRRNLPALGDAGFRAIAVDLPGQGESDKPSDTAHYTVPAMAGHLMAVLEDLELDRVALVGQSLGGRVAIELCRGEPRRVSRLAILAPVGLAHVRLVRVAKLLMPRLPAPVLAALGWRVWWSLGLRHAYGKRARPTERDIDEYWAPSRDPSYVAGLVAYLRGVDWRPLAREQLERLPLPTLVVAGTRDPLLRCEEIAKRANWLPSAELVVIEGAGHPIQEEVPDEVNLALTRFLNS